MRRELRGASCAAFLFAAMLVAVRCAPAQQEPQLATGSDEQQQAIAEALRKHSLTFRMEDGVLRGPGADFLEKESGKAQFVLFGEEHYVKEFPLFLSALFSILHREDGFNYLAVESDPISAHLTSNAPLRGDLKAIGAYAAEYPNAFTFPTDQELQMFADVGRTAAGKADAIWGLDQSFGALHALDRLKELPGFRSTAKFAELHAQAQQMDAARFASDERHYMGRVSKPGDWEELRRELKPAVGSEAEFILNNLVNSSRIYGFYWSGQRYRNGSEREQQMKDLFTREYRAAQREGEQTPKVMIKMGHYHIFRGLGPTNIQTLGNFVSELATFNGTESFALGVYLRGPWRDVENSRWKGLRPIGLATDAALWTIIDFRGLRPEVSSGKFGTLDPELLRAIYGFDAALVIGGAAQGTETFLEQKHP